MTTKTKWPAKRLSRDKGINLGMPSRQTRCHFRLGNFGSYVIAILDVFERYALPSQTLTGYLVRTNQEAGKGLQGAEFPKVPLHANQLSGSGMAYMIVAEGEPGLLFGRMFKKQPAVWAAIPTGGAIYRRLTYDAGQDQVQATACVHLGLEDAPEIPIGAVKPIPGAEAYQSFQAPEAVTWPVLSEA